MLESKEFSAYSNSQVIDEGLRNYMLKIYNYMAGGLCATALTAYLIVKSHTQKWRALGPPLFVCL